MNLNSQAIQDAARSFAEGHGLAKGYSEKLQKDLDTRLSTLANGLNLSPTELRQLTTTVLQHAQRVANGQHTTATTDDWSRKSLADLKSRHVSNQRVREILDSTNAWLKATYPAVHQALKQDGALGSHPAVVRHLTDRYLKHEQDAERAARSAKWLSKSRAQPQAGHPGTRGFLSGSR